MFLMLGALERAFPSPCSAPHNDGPLTNQVIAINPKQMQLMREMNRLGEFQAWEVMLPATKQRLRKASTTYLPLEDSRAFWYVADSSAATLWERSATVTCNMQQ